MSLLEEGQIIRDTWEVERFLGEGAFAEVYRVRHRFLGRQAMKVFKTPGMGLEEIEQMLGEALMLSRIGHANVIRVFDANVTESSVGLCGFFTMEYIAGGSLDRFWKSHGAQFVPVETVVEIMRQVCEGLGLAHRETPPIIHRDIKPQNILVGYDTAGLRARVSDFGLAKQVNPLTLLASARGTPGFKAPEVLKDFQCDSCAGDVWALGVTLYLLLTDMLPYTDDSEDDFDGEEEIDRPLICPSRINLQVDKALDQVVLRALARDPKERYQSAVEMLRDLLKWKPKAAAKEDADKQVVISPSSKDVLGAPSPANEPEARKMIKDAIQLSRQMTRLAEAADMMEEAFNKWPHLREEHEYYVKLWRKGIIS